MVELSSELRALVLAALVSLGLVACSNNQLGALGTSSKPGSITLTTSQREATRAGVRRMVPNPETATFTGETARQGKPGEGLHVCGHVSYKDPVASKPVEQPFYVELRESNGRPNAERGQVGGDPAKLAKVRFLCRNH